VALVALVRRPAAMVPLRWMNPTENPAAQCHLTCGSS
jgi:hypothetical protein